ncbi:MAG: RNA polymerase sigma factor [Bacteroidia bacterium]
MKRKINFLLLMHGKGADSRSDAELALGCRNGDRHCFDILAVRYRKQFHPYFSRLLRSSARADDVMQQALLIAWLRLSTGRYKEEEHFGDWLFIIAYHEAMFAIRKEKPLRHPEQMPEQPEEAQDDEREEQKIILDALIAKLPESERQVIIMHDKMEMDYKEIGRQLGIHPDSALRAHERAVIDLKRMLGKTK